MQEFLRWNPCRCGEVPKLTGAVYYTAPLGYTWECSNFHKGIVGYTDLSETDIKSTQK